MGKFLKLPSGELSTLADHERKEQLKKTLGHAPPPLFKEVRELVLRKCVPDKENQFRVMFEKHPFGEVERLVIQKLLDVAKRVAKEELESENWVHQVARLTGRSHEEIRVSILEFLDTDALNLSIENSVTFLDPLIESWDFDLATFGMEIVLNGRLAPGDPKKFEFVEREPGQAEGERGLKEFLRDASLSAGATEEEIEFLKRLRIKGKRPTALYYYRELQNLRDPLNFRALMTRSRQEATPGPSQPEGSIAQTHNHMEAKAIEKQLQLAGRKRAAQHWAGNKDSRGKKERAKS